MSEEREEVYQILELGKHEKNLHHKKGFGGLLFIDLSMIKFSKLSSYIRQLDKENQELKQKYENAVADYETTMAEKNKLKKKLEVPETCNLKTLEDYKNYYEDTTREQILEDTYIEYCAYVNLAHRYSELKKQLEEYKEQVNKGLYNTCLPYTTGYNKAIKDKETQQKEFINYLEDEIQKKREKATTLTSFTRNVVPLKHCLQKYKSIIGDDK